jgi:hypothetical protein
MLGEVVFPTMTRQSWSAFEALLMAQRARARFLAELRVACDRGFF